jgi:hypothetical protein
VAISAGSSFIRASSATYRTSNFVALIEKS